MVRKVTASVTKAKILALLDDASAGEEFEITKHGRTVARLVPARGAKTLRGSMMGLAMSTASDDDLFQTGVVWDVS
jgi:prevent-host-death family protein